MILSPPHEAKTCPNPRKNEGCVCDLREWARGHSDWPIAKLVGNLVYAQLVDSSPGLFESFPDFKNDGNCPSSISALTSAEHLTTEMRRKSKNITDMFTGPQPTPNFISTLLVEGYNMGDVKRELIYLATGGDAGQNGVTSLVGKTRGYTYSELSLGEIVCMLCVYSVMVSICAGIGFAVWHHASD